MRDKHQHHSAVDIRKNVSYVHRPLPLQIHRRPRAAETKHKQTCREQGYRETGCVRENASEEDRSNLEKQALNVEYAQPLPMIPRDFSSVAEKERTIRSLRLQQSSACGCLVGKALSLRKTMDESRLSDLGVLAGAPSHLRNALQCRWRGGTTGSQSAEARERNRHQPTAATTAAMTATYE